ncbi:MULTISPECIES: methylmalonyl-CoA epimerase [unclassified Roseiflexus]|jgi:methylmalonyl-CoA epimerase (EC 5.1.99.1)|uniref:methylmalonyl-CoA epimerase n=1 Tax=unclassified Roseiflexus TaxID=2609473 RepID=UPI0000D81F71|nr:MULTISPECIES: methylmalonyl-CoA epimerase [unclassified Roseiflexus]ABQ88905.1 methylmalonyl-CoA epimerase [Roseiflexus sp. RS-1]MBO9322814.1 methylmalonyl-CoA epimerase [Roseiflexus sp.]MBO9343903.1 methylmalonyl-CoA epimerase [Roseiflexus sp.]MCL6542320.1 methylmalonyl-CoA epimerase [Roseiflexus sp.]
MFEKVDHIGFAVRDIDSAIAFYSQTFGISEWERIPMPERHMEVAATRMGDMLLELIAPTSDEAAFAKYLNERGPGMHHIAYRVNDIVAALAEIKARGVQLIDETPRPGLHDTLVAFLHPKSCQGVLVELVQHRH